MLRRAGFALFLAILCGFLALGSGFSLYWDVAFVMFLALIGGFLWAYLGLVRLDVQLERLTTHSQVGVPLEGRLRLVNGFRFSKSWLEVEELTDLPEPGSGRVVTVPGREARAWRHIVQCNQRGVFHLGPVRVTSSDPFGLFRLSRNFLEPERIVVHPRAKPLPNFNLPIATFPSDGRFTQRSPYLDAQASSVRDYVYGDSVSRVHWPYTARKGSLMVKEFDRGLSSEVWIVLDLQGNVQAGEGLDNTEELSVTVAASVASKLLAMEVPVGLAAHGDRSYLLQPDHGAGHTAALMEELALMRALGHDPLERTLYQLERYLGRLSTLLVVTPTTDMGWMLTIANLRRRGVRVASILVDPSSFGSHDGVGVPLERLHLYDIPAYTLKRGQDLDEALSSPLGPPPLGIPSRANGAFR